MISCDENDNEIDHTINRPRRRHGHKHTKHGIPR